jgi:hypothetical protein
MTSSTRAPAAPSDGRPGLSALAVGTFGPCIRRRIGEESFLHRDAKRAGGVPGRTGVEMTFGVVALVVTCGWSLLSIVMSVTFGAIAEARDADPAPADHVVADVTHGDATYHGSTGPAHLGDGYALVNIGGDVFNFSAQPFFGWSASNALTIPPIAGVSAIG